MSYVALFFGGIVGGVIVSTYMFFAIQKRATRLCEDGFRSMDARHELHQKLVRREFLIYILAMFLIASLVAGTVNSKEELNMEKNSAYEKGYNAGYEQGREEGRFEGYSDALLEE